MKSNIDHVSWKQDTNHILSVQFGKDTNHNQHIKKSSYKTTKYKYLQSSLQKKYNKHQYGILLVTLQQNQLFNVAAHQITIMYYLTVNIFSVSM